MSYFSSKDILIYGYIRRMENEYKFYVNIPIGIIQIISNLFARNIMKFDLFNSQHFSLNEDGNEITGKGTLGWKCCGFFCAKYFIYPDMDNDVYYDDGFDKGIHFWAVECFSFFRCCREIGIINEKNVEIAMSTNYYFDEEDDEPYLYLYPDDEYDELWNVGDRMTVKLDCNKWKLTYFRNDLQVHCMEIEPNESYYFVLKICASAQNHFKSCNKNASIMK